MGAREPETKTEAVIRITALEEKTDKNGDTWLALTTDTLGSCSASAKFEHLHDDLRGAFASGQALNVVYTKSGYNNYTKAPYTNIVEVQGVVGGPTERPPAAAGPARPAAAPPAPGNGAARPPAGPAAAPGADVRAAEAAKDRRALGSVAAGLLVKSGMVEANAAGWQQATRMVDTYINTGQY